MKKYYLKIFGCQMNESDSQRIASFLEQQHYQNTDKMENADLIIVTACSVRQSAIDRIFGLKKKFKNLSAKKILTGCVLKQDKIKFASFFDEVLSIDEFLGKNYLELQPKISNPNSAYVPIMTGCNNFCTYCAVPYTRGREISRKTKNIIQEIKNLLKNNYKEITLLGQNVNSYKDKKSNFPKLLKAITEIPGNFIIKFLTSHPKDMSDELIKIIAESPKISREIHLPVQSGDNEILKKMNRNYTREHYISLINKIKTKIPEAKITTDVIVGFPSETKKQFENTIKLFKEVGFSMAYVNKYSTRPGTAAAQFKDDVPWKEKVKRWETLNELTNKPKVLPKLVVVLGPTASGKSELAVNLALRLRSERPPMKVEIISADSRQIYKEMNIGTGKITLKETNGVTHHLINIASPKKQLSVAEYKKLAEEAINKIIKKGKTPILCGGTGFYIQAITDNIIIPEVAPDWNLRKKLEKKTAEELFKQLKKLDPNRAQNIDAKNKRRLIRAIEIILKTGKPISKIKINPQYNVLYVGIKKSNKELKQNIDKRIDKMFKMGLEKEVKKIVKKYGWTIVLKNTIGYAEFQNQNPIDAIKLHTYQYAKKQLTWFKKYPGNKIHWVSNKKETEKLIKKFLF